MLIVSQDKKQIANLDIVSNVNIMQINNTTKVIAICLMGNYMEDNFFDLATYENEVKAKRVLESLWSAYANGFKVFIMPEK